MNLCLQKFRNVSSYFCIRKLILCLRKSVDQNCQRRNTEPKCSVRDSNPMKQEPFERQSQHQSRNEANGYATPYLRRHARGGNNLGGRKTIHCPEENSNSDPGTPPPEFRGRWSRVVIQENAIYQGERQSNSTLPLLVNCRPALHFPPDASTFKATALGCISLHANPLSHAHTIQALYGLILACLF